MGYFLVVFLLSFLGLAGFFGLLELASRIGQRYGEVWNYLTYAVGFAFFIALAAVIYYAGQHGQGRIW